MIPVRAPIVAGTFYNIDKELLKKQIERCFDHKLGPKEVKTKSFTAAIVPHAGYEFSGAVAAWVYSRMEKANFIILGPNHTGTGARFALMKAGMWKTPLGEVVVNEKIAQELFKECKILDYDFLAHENEHSIEVQLPFLQYRFGDDFKFIPICILNEFADETLLETCKAIGKGIAGMIKKQKEKWIILASSDFSHYVSYQQAKKTDNYLIKAILKLNEKDFFTRINEKNASVCGFGPIAIAMIAAKELGAKKGELLKYSTSGDITGDTRSVVGYASIII